MVRRSRILKTAWSPDRSFTWIKKETGNDNGTQSYEKSMTVLEIGLKRLPITFCSPKITRFSSQRFHSQKALGLHKGSDAVFQPSIGILARADREFEFLGPRTTLQGSAKKLDDAPKLKLPEVSCYLRCLLGATLDFKRRRCSKEFWKFRYIVWKMACFPNF